ELLWTLAAGCLFGLFRAGENLAGATFYAITPFNPRRHDARVFAREVRLAQLIIEPATVRPKIGFHAYQDAAAAVLVRKLRGAEDDPGDSAEAKRSRDALQRFPA